jgi:hypothetical protein
MAIIIKIDNPSGLLTAIKKAIDEKSIETWSYDKDGDFIHTTSDGQWINKAWLRPKIYIGELRFGLLGVKDTKMTEEIYSIYHGRFTEMLIAHFSTKFSNITVTARKSESDNFQY